VLSTAPSLRGDNLPSLTIWQALPGEAKGGVWSKYIDDGGVCLRAGVSASTARVIQRTILRSKANRLERVSSAMNASTKSEPRIVFKRPPAEKQPGSKHRITYGLPNSSPVLNPPPLDRPYSLCYEPRRRCAAITLCACLVTPVRGRCVGEAQETGANILSVRTT
jgi:hypothetical protein